MKKSTTSLLIIYILFLTPTFGQSLYLEINGVNELESKILDSLNYNTKFYELNDLILEKEEVKKRLYKKGFIENQEVSSSRKNDTIHQYNFSLNKRYRDIHIHYNAQIVSSDVLDKFTSKLNDEYFSIPFEMVEQTLDEINKEIVNQGTPFKTLQLIDIRKKGEGILEADLSISDETQRQIDKIVIAGYEKFPRSFLKHYLKIKPNVQFNLDEIKLKADAINELSFASQIKPPEVLFTKDSTTIYIYMEKRPSNTFDGFLGFGTNEQTNKIEFDGYLDLNLTNNLNFGESLQLQYKSDEIDQKTFNGILELPYILSTRLGTQLQLNIFKKDSTFSTIQQSAKLFYQLNSKSKIFAGIRSVQSNDLLDGMSTLPIDDYNSLFYNLSYSYRSRENYNDLFPINFQFVAEGGLGRRSLNDQDMSQSNFSFDSFKIFNLSKKNSVFIRSNGSFLFSDTYLFNELSRFGGINSIRGFEENSLFATSFAVLNTEYRYKISKSLYVNSIIDGAYFENDLQDTKEKLFGFGFGFGLLTNSGLLKLNYANGKNENQKFKFSNSKVHISLKASF